MQVNSTHIADVEWNEGVLRVRFVKGGEYEYADVPQGIFLEMISAPSVGAYFKENIKGVYDFVRVG